MKLDLTGLGIDVTPGIQEYAEKKETNTLLLNGFIKAKTRRQESSPIVRAFKTMFISR